MVYFIAMTSQKFFQEYKKLNTEQKKAVDTIEGPVMVIAGPGTGKTQILTLRIANILKKTDTTPDSILALTFTEAGVYSMRQRLVSIIGSSAYKVGIYTFHGFCNDIIKRFPESFPNIIGSENINIIDQIQIWEKIIKGAKLSKLKPYGNNFYYVRPLIGVIGKLKKENIGLGELEKQINKEDVKQNELLFLYKKYQNELSKNHLYDYDDMVMEVIVALEKDKELLLSLQERYQYILADEHQDANHSQNTLVELLANYWESPNLFIVGDEKQAIFRFQGASLENFNYFKRLYKGAKVITLNINYRSNQNILDGAYSLLPKDGKLTAGAKRKLQKIKLAVLPSPDAEVSFVTCDIEKKINRGVAPSEIAILYRDNKDALAFIRSFEKSSTPFIVESDQDILDDIDIRKLIVLLRAVCDITDREAFALALHIDFLCIESVNIYKSITEKKDEQSVAKMRDKITGWHKMSYNKNLVEVFEIIVRESGFLNYILGLPDGSTKLEKLDAFFDEIKTLIENHRGYRLSDFLSYIDLLEEHSILIKQDRQVELLNSVRLMTAHRSKGQEFGHVYIVGAHDGHWGRRRKVDYFKLPVLGSGDEGDDERRLFYVALTRAKESVTISYSIKGAGGRTQMPSQFTEELDKKFTEDVDTSFVKVECEKKFGEKVNYGYSLSDKEYLNKLFLSRGLSVTALNNYLECPWRYFFNNLVRIPTAINKHQMYGIATHATLKDVFEKLKNGESVTKKVFLNTFKKYLKRQPISGHDFEETLHKGNESLGGYYTARRSKWKLDTLNEYRVRVRLVVSNKEIKELSINGVLDKIEIVSGGVNVTDYKTGKPKSRNDIEGKTKTSNGNYKRQLVFYKLLLDLEGKYKMMSGEIDFLEPNKSGKYINEKFDISIASVDELKKDIDKVASEIYELSFWNKKCDEKKCQHCKMREMMK